MNYVAVTFSNFENIVILSREVTDAVRPESYADFTSYVSALKAKLTLAFPMLDITYNVSFYDCNGRHIDLVVTAK